MAGNNIVINSKFKPFSYEELIRPYEKYGEAYREQETLLSDLESQAALMENIANTESGSKAAGLYNKYNKAIQNQADLLAKDGLKQGSRKALLDLKKQYNTQIAPIGIAAQRKAALVEEQMKLKAADPTIEFDTDYREGSIDDLIEDPLKSYKYISGNQVAQRSAQLLHSELMKNIEQELSSDDIKSLMEPIKETLKQEFGIKEDDEKMDDLLSNFAESGYGVALEAYRQQLLKEKEYKLREKEYNLREDNFISSEAQRKAELAIAQNAATQNTEFNALRLENQRLENEELQKSLGKLPYWTDEDGAQHFRDSYFTWTVDASGVKSKPEAIKTKEEIKAEAEAEAERVKLENEEIIYENAAPVVVKDVKRGVREKAPSAGPGKMVTYNTLTSEEQRFVRETINKYWPGVDVNNFRIYKSGKKYKFVPIPTTLKTTKRELDIALKGTERVTTPSNQQSASTDTTSSIDTVGL